MGSSKKQTVGYKYYLGMHMVLCHGPADALYQIRVDDKAAWTGASEGGQITIAAEGLFGGESREGGVSGLVDVEMGGTAQAANSYLSGLLSNVPGFRGVMGLVLRKCYLGMNPYLKRWSAVVQRINVTQDGDAQWYLAKAAIPSGNSLPGRAETNFISEIALDANTYIGPASNPARTYTISGLEPTDILTFTIRPDLTYQAWSRWNGTSAPYPPLAWTTGFWVTDDANVQTGYYDSLSFTAPYYFATSAEAEAYGASRPPISVTGSTSYRIDFHDEALALNSGGLSLSVAISRAAIALLDMNPAHIIRECLVNPDWGMGYSSADIGDTAFTAAADTLFTESFGLSLIWDKQMPLEDFIKEVLRHIDATLFVNRATGTFTLKLIRDDYDEGTLLVLDESNVSKVDDFSRRGFDELYNSVTIKYVDSGTNRDAAVEVQDIAQIQIQNAIINTTATYAGISNATVASKVAARDLRAMSSPLAACTIYASTVAKDLTIGDTFKLTWPDFDVDTLIMRVAAISYGDGVNNSVRIQATQDVFSTPDITYVAIPTVEWTDVNAPPVPVDFQTVFEVPYYELVQQLGQATADSTLAANTEAGYVGAAAVQPGGAINAVLSTDAGAGYVEAGAFNFCPSATIESDLSRSTVVVELAGGVNLADVVAGTHAQLNDEILVVVSIVGTTFTFERGALDTVPAEHVTGDRVFFWDALAGSDPTEYNTGETINSKVLPITGLGQLALGDAVAMPLTMAQRAFRPYPPADFKIAGSYFPTLIDASFNVTWVHRDRLQQTGGVILSFLDGTIGPEAGTTYNVRAYDNDTSTLLDSVTSLSALTWTPAIVGSYRLRVELESQRDSIVSWQKHSWVFDYTVDGRLTEDGQVLTSEASEIRQQE